MVRGLILIFGQCEDHHGMINVNNSQEYFYKMGNMCNNCCKPTLIEGFDIDEM